MPGRDCAAAEPGRPAGAWNPGATAGAPGCPGTGCPGMTGPAIGCPGVNCCGGSPRWACWPAAGPESGCADGGPACCPPPRGSAWACCGGAAGRGAVSGPEMCAAAWPGAGWPEWRWQARRHHRLARRCVLRRSGMVVSRCRVVPWQGRMLARWSGLAGQRRRAGQCGRLGRWPRLAHRARLGRPCRWQACLGLPCRWQAWWAGCAGGRPGWTERSRGPGVPGCPVPPCPVPGWLTAPGGGAIPGCGPGAEARLWFPGDAVPLAFGQRRPVAVRRLRGPLVLGDHRPGVEPRRCGMRAHGHRRLPDHPGGAVAVGGRAARVGGYRLALFLPDRLRPDDKLHRRPQMRLADLDDFVALLAERGGGRPAGRGDVHQDHPQAEILHVGDHLREVFLRAHHQRVADRPVPGERGQVAVDLACHALAAAGLHLAEPQLHPGQVSEDLVLGTAAALDRGLVPVAAQQRQAGAIACHVPQDFEYPGMVPGNGLPVAGAVNGHRAIS